MGRTKAALARTILAANVTFLLADVDVVFLRDPLPYLRTQLDAGAQLLFHTDNFGSSEAAIRSGGLEDPAHGFALEMNTGLFLMTPAAAPLAHAWCDALSSDSAFANWQNDQQALNKLMRRGARTTSTLIRAFDGTLALGLLPSHLFPSGHVFFIQRQNAALGVTPFAVHLTFQNCDQSGKRHRIREAMLWEVDPPEHFDPPGGLLSFALDLPPRLTSGFAPLSRNLRIDDALVARHFALANHQLLQVRTALALALALNRTLILPRFLCGLETVTNFPHSGVRCRGSAGCAMRLPYWCPADHVLRMHYLAGVMPQRPQLDVRVAEHSLLHHPSAPPRALADRVDVSIVGTAERAVRGAAETCAACGDSGYIAPRPALPPASRHASVPAGQLTSTSVAARLASHADARLLHFTSLRPGELDVSLAPSPMQQRFEATVKPLGGGWCCVEPPTRGAPMHFWYDMLWDLPHVDRWGKTWTAQHLWTPQTGP